MNEVLVAIILGGFSAIAYFVGAFIFYGYCFSYWENEYPASAGSVGNVIASIMFTLLFPMFLLPFILVRAWKHGTIWRLK